MRLRTDGDYAYRLDEIEAVADLFDRNKTASVIRACEHARRDARVKKQLAEWLIEEHRAGRLTDDQLKEIAAHFDRTHIGLEVTVDRTVATTIDRS